MLKIKIEEVGIEMPFGRVRSEQLAIIEAERRDAQAKVWEWIRTNRPDLGLASNPTEAGAGSSLERKLHHDQHNIFQQRKYHLLRRATGVGYLPSLRQGYGKEECLCARRLHRDGRDDPRPEAIR